MSSESTTQDTQKAQENYLNAQTVQKKGTPTIHFLLPTLCLARQSHCLPSSALSYYLPRLYHIPPQPLFTHSSSLTHASIFATTLGEPLALLPPPPPPPPKYAHRLWDPTTMLSLSLHHPSQAKGFRSTPILACHYALLLFLLLLIIHHAAAGDIG